MSQLGMVVYARFDPMRYCCWAPFDSLNRYHVRAVVAGHELDKWEFRHRYGLFQQGTDGAIQHVKDILVQVERGKDRGARAVLSMTYTTNSIHPQRWIWRFGIEDDFPLDPADTPDTFPTNE